MGYAFSYPVVRYLTAGVRPKRVPIIAYIHYPTISSSMLRRVSSRESNYANSGQIASSTVLSTGKLMCSPRFPSINLVLTYCSVIIACLRQCISTVFVLRTQCSRSTHRGQVDILTPYYRLLYIHFLHQYRSFSPHSPFRSQPITTVINVENRLQSSTRHATPNNSQNSR